LFGENIGTCNDFAVVPCANAGIYDLTHSSVTARKKYFNHIFHILGNLSSVFKVIDLSEIVISQTQ